MKICEGVYHMARPDCSITGKEALSLIDFLLSDVTSDNPQIHWRFHPKYHSTNIYLGTGLNGGKNNVTVQKTIYKDGMKVCCEYFEGPISLYTIVDFCLDPDSSALLKLNAQIAPRVIAAAIASPPRVKDRRIFQPK